MILLFFRGKKMGVRVIGYVDSLYNVHMTRDYSVIDVDTGSDNYAAVSVNTGGDIAYLIFDMSRRQGPEMPCGMALVELNCGYVLGAPVRAASGQYNITRLGGEVFRSGANIRSVIPARYAIYSPPPSDPRLFLP